MHEQSRTLQRKISKSRLMGPSEIALEKLEIARVRSIVEALGWDLVSVPDADRGRRFWVAQRPSGRDGRQTRSALTADDLLSRLRHPQGHLLDQPRGSGREAAERAAP